MKIKNKEKTKKLILTFIIILIIIIIFTFFDYLTHQIEEEYAVPSRYYTNKIIYGTIFGAITYFFIQNKKPFTKALIFSVVVSTLLQVRYFFEGYSTHFVFLFLVIHFLILLPVSWIGFKIKSKYYK